MLPNEPQPPTAFPPECPVCPLWSFSIKSGFPLGRRRGLVAGEASEARIWQRDLFEDGPSKASPLAAIRGQVNVTAAAQVTSSSRWAPASPQERRRRVHGSALRCQGVAPASVLTS